MTDIHQYEPLWGSWYVDSLIGEGSFGKVYKVRKEEFGKPYYSAVKIISIPQNESDLRQMKSEGLDDASVKSYFHAFVADIIQEIDLMSEFRGNSNIVSFEDHKVIEKMGEIGWDILIRMELLTSLTDYATEKPLSSAEVLKLGIHISKALELCAVNKTIHRDIKPDNIFVSNYGEYKLGDFGIARQIERTMSGLSKKGTYTYMAPEVFRGDDYGASVDLYSLGIVMYRFLNQNRTPFLPDFPNPISPKERDESMQRRMRGESLPPILGVDASINAVVLKACAFDRNQRFKTAKDLREALEVVAGGGTYTPVYTPVQQANAFSASEPADANSTVIIGINSANTGADKTAGTELVYTSRPGFAGQGTQHEHTSRTEGVWDSTARPTPTSPQKKRRRGLIAGICASAAVIALAAVIVVNNGFGLFGQAEDTDYYASLIEDTSEPEPAVEPEPPSPSQLPEPYEAIKISVDMTADGVVDLSNMGIIDISEYDIPAGVLTLRLGDNQIEDISALSDLRSLKALGLSNNRIADVTPLMNLVDLNKLSISGNQIDNISSLKSLSNLEILYLIDNPLTQAQVDALRLALPRCDIHWESTDGAPSAAPTGPPTQSEPSITSPSPSTSMPPPRDPTADNSPRPSPSTPPSQSPIPSANPSPSPSTSAAPSPSASPSPSPSASVSPSVSPSKKLVTSITVSPASQTMDIGGTFTFNAGITPSDATNKSVTWTSDDSSIAAVSTTGVVTAKKAGSTYVYASANDGSNIWDYALVTVREKTVPVTGVSVSPATTTLDVGGTYTLSATVSPSNATDKTVTWSSNNTSVATVDANGRVSAIRAGSATITAITRDGGFSKYCTVTVKDAVIKVTSLTVSPATATLDVGGIYTLSATVSPSNAADKTVTWSSNNTSVATVDTNGRVSAIRAGSATITATTRDGSFSKFCTVTVAALPDPLQITSVSLDKSNYKVGEYASVTVKAIGEASQAFIKSETGEEFAKQTNYSTSGNTRTFTLSWELGVAGNRTVSAGVSNAKGETVYYNFSVSVVAETLKIISINVANPYVKVGEYCWMTVTTSADITSIWITNETGGDTVYDLTRSYAVGSSKGWDIGWQLGKSGNRTGNIIASNGSNTTSKSFNCTAYD